MTITKIMSKEDIRRALMRIAHEILEKNKGAENLCIVGIRTRGMALAARRRRLEQFKQEERTLIFYESPHRLVKALADIEDVLGNLHIVCARELTKKFEEVKEGLVGELREHFSKIKPRGEFVLLVNRGKKSKNNILNTN